MSVDFPTFFERATGSPPYAYQRRLAADGLPDVLEAPMGSGKTPALILAWLWRLVEAELEVQFLTPRRLVFALPMRTLVDQVEVNVRVWLDNLGLQTDVLVNVVMGGRRSEEKQWRLAAHRPSITIGTIDSLASKALLRGYGTSRAVAPIDFALVTNGAHIVVDEIQLVPAATATLRQVAAFQRDFATAEPVGLTCSSATVDQRILDTVDNPVAGSRTVALTDDDRTGRLGSLLIATKSVRRLHADAADHKAIALHASARHRPGSRTLIVTNTVKAAVGIARAVRRAKPDAEVLLIHSRFRPRERATLADRLVSPPVGAGTVVIATQVVEAGVDIDSSVMITEASPWPSLCQRSGRCNRYGAVPDAELWWHAAGKSGPYDPADVAESERVLAGLEGDACTGEQLLAREVADSDLALKIIRRPDFLSLFDTTPDLSGNDIDISPYIRSGDQLDCLVSWIATDVRGHLDSAFRPPDQEWRCPAPIGEVRAWLNTGIRAWTFSTTNLQRWERVDRQTRIRPGDLILVHSDEGGYDPAYGFTPGHPGPVQTGLDEADSGGEISDAIVDDSTNTGHREWLSLDAHLEETGEQARKLLAACAPDLSPASLSTVSAAALLHDVGKMHPDWQQALRNTASQPPPPDGLLAKSPGRGRLTYRDRAGFRHELVSALVVSSAGAGGLLNRASFDGADTALLRYLVAAHHGKVRMQIPAVMVDDDQVLGVRPDEILPAETILGMNVPPTDADLDALGPGGGSSWTRAALELLATYGPFRLAYMEALVRLADWRASADLPLPGHEDGQ